MKIVKIMAVSALACLMLVVVVGIVAAAPAGLSHIAMLPAGDDPKPTITSTVTPVPTTTVPHTQPVASAIALFFHIPYSQVIALHDSGIGFGVIARAYLTARASNGVLTPTQLLMLHEEGVGWGQIKKEFGVHPGGLGLGSIMSGKSAHEQGGSGNPPGNESNGAPSGMNVMSPGKPSCPGNSCNAPGRNKSGKGPK